MEVTQAVKIVNQCISYQKEHGEFPLSKYNVINQYRRLAFKTLSEELKPMRKVQFATKNNVQYFDKKQVTRLGFF
jgi:hypothetical protein